MPESEPPLGVRDRLLHPGTWIGFLWALFGPVLGGMVYVKTGYVFVAILVTWAVTVITIDDARRTIPA